MLWKSAETALRSLLKQRLEEEEDHMKLVHTRRFFH
jgi:hypothetical protein